MSAEAYDRKYTDRQVREDHHLKAAAYNYLRAYQGEYEYLVDLKYLLSQQNALTTAQIRGTLNCMRHDPRVAGDLPDPYEDIELEQRSPRQRRARLEVVPDPPVRRWVIELRVDFKKEFMWSGHVQAKKIHVIDYRKSKLLYYPTPPDSYPQYKPVVYGMCGLSYSYKTLQMGNVPPFEFEECTRCFDDPTTEYGQ